MSFFSFHGRNTRISYKFGEFYIENMQNANDNN